MGRVDLPVPPVSMIAMNAEFKFKFEFEFEFEFGSDGANKVRVCFSSPLWKSRGLSFIVYRAPALGVQVGHVMSHHPTRR